jgi:hypothetical protein
MAGINRVAGTTVLALGKNGHKLETVVRVDRGGSARAT